jgi:RNA polymerase sigma-70 factor (sigma-E family)
MHRHLGPDHPVMPRREEEFEHFVRGNRASLVRFATALTAGDSHLAEDLVQAALVRVYLAKPTRIGNLQGYVRRAVVNGLIDHKRRPFFRREHSAPELPELADTAPEGGVDPQLLTALAALPVRMRAAIVLRHLEGFSIEETAAALGCSAGNVKSQTSRGLDKLRALLAPGTTSCSPYVLSTVPVTDPRASIAPKGERSCPTS